MIFISPAKLLLIQPLVVSAAGPIQEHAASKIFIHELQENKINLHKILHESGGVLRIGVNRPDIDIMTSDTSEDSYKIASLRKEALTALCTCPAFDETLSPSGDALFKQLLEKHPKDVQQIELPDGSSRRTLATATVGFDGNEEEEDSATSHPLQLPIWFQEECGHDAYDAMENLRDAVSKVVNLFVEKLDGEKQRNQSYRQVLQSANHLEHFHVYFEEETSLNEEVDQDGEKMGNNSKTSQHSVGTHNHADTKTTTTLDFHTDAGFFLAFVPAMNCHTNSVDDTSFYLKSQEQPLKFAEDEVVILMGAGAQYWMNNGVEDSYSFVAAPHALRLLHGAHRSWYGKMHLLPSSLTSETFHATSLESTHSSSVAYGEVLPTFQLENYKAHVPSSPVDGCGISPLEEPVTPTASTQTERNISRRRLQHVSSPANCNNETNFFCWYQCLSIPSAEHTLDYLRDGYSLYCLDPSKLTDVVAAAEPCKGGYTHNSACTGSWQLTDSSVQGYDFPNYAAALEEEKAAAATYPAPDTGDEYCYGGTSMYMDGFNWIGSTCVIYLFPQWVLSTPGKFAVACIGSILFGILLEYVLWKRRVVYSMKPGRRRLVLSVLAYGLQLTMGYIIMLVIMTYSGPLFVSTVGGMMMGHALFNAQDSFVKWKDVDSKDSQEAGAGTSEQRRSTELASNYRDVDSGTYGSNNGEVDEEAEAVGSCCGLGASAASKNERPFGVTETTKLKENIPEGVTPCCQYVL